ncbi:MAG: hypothetical protein NZ108_07910, partial [Bacteroidia bacterium]|nr:hypothetical protein [Bacteroidia bacterium]
LTNAIDSGIQIPSYGQSKDGFELRFRIQNISAERKTIFYQLYYQNASYAYPNSDSLSSLNFYGSLTRNQDYRKIELAPLEAIEVREFHRIEGNPRLEERYFGYDISKPLSVSEVQPYLESIKQTPEWIASIIQKAKKNQRSVDEQIRLDAEYMALEKRKQTKFNQRWKRNPRVGDYEFLLIICTETAYQQIPIWVRNITQKKPTGQFQNPFSYFDTTKITGIKVIRYESLLHTNLKARLGNGIYVRPTDFTDQNLPFNPSCQNPTCNSDSTMYQKADFMQFIHKVRENYAMNNIPVVADVLNYTRKEYEENAKLYANQRKKLQIQITDCPCKTVFSDSVEQKIIIRNPAATVKRLRKENVGVIFRHGLTYGKFTAKVKMPSMLSKDGVWTGLTNAVWMINQANEAWNFRRQSKSGYIDMVTGERKAEVGYSEIDFEMVKAPLNWPQTSYKNIKRPPEPPGMEKNIVVTCTNWDLASRDPKNFVVGVKPIVYQNQTFDLHRWDDWYKAITSKYAVPDSEIFGTEYYFQIEWKPTEIIWRIGPSKDKLRVCGYMNSTVTEIPDNQMCMVFTQEYHMANWWPESPFNQDFIPCPLIPLQGEILSLEVE